MVNNEELPNVETTLEKVLDGYPLLMPYDRKPDNEYYKTKIYVITTCPSCEQPWKRLVYLQQYMEYPMTLVLVMCDECSNKDEYALVGNNKAWNKNV